MNRDEFLERVRRASRAGRAYEVHARESFPPRAGYTDIADDLCDRLAHEVIAVGGHAHLVESLAAAQEVLSQLLTQYAAQSAFVWQHDVLRDAGLDELLAAHRVSVLTHDAISQWTDDRQRQAMLAADIGITSVDYAIAETGTLVLMSAPGRERLASLLPPIHVAIVRGNQLLADLFDLFELLDCQHLPSNLVLITGPSKTGDIELTLTTGVHGPREWHVIIDR